jgi:hypothetical protein
VDLQPRTTTVYSEDRDWLKDANGIHLHKATLDYSAFTLADHFPLGYIPSGMGLRKLTSGLYGPAAGTGGVDNETQTITIAATGGTFTVSLGGETTAAVDFDATAAELQAALEDLLGVEPGDIVVTGGPGATAAFVLTFGGQYGGENVPQVTTGAGSLTGGAGTATVATTNAGSGSAGTPAGLLWSAESMAGANDVHIAVLDAGNILSARLPTNHGWNAEMAAALPRIADYS